MRIATFAPYLVFTLWLGVVVDRRKRKPLMVFSDAGRGVVLVTIGILALTELLTVPLLLATATMLGILEVLFALADFSLLPTVVTERQLADANAKVTATQSAVNVGGSGAGGALIQAVTAPVAVLVNSFGFLFSALVIHWTRVDEPEPEQREGGSALRDAAQGVTLLLRDPSLRALAAEATLWNFGNEILTLAVTVALVEGSDRGPLLLGIVLMAGGVGAFLGSAISARLTARFGYGPSLVVALLVGNSAPIAGALTLRWDGLVSVALLAVAYLLSGVGIGVANSQATTVRQLLTSEHLRGRLNAAYRLLSWGALSVGALVAGVVITAFDPSGAGLAGAVVMALATAPVAFSPVRTMRTLGAR